LKIVRVVNIVDGGEGGVSRPSHEADAAMMVAPPPVVQTSAARPEEGTPFNPGVNRTEVRVRVDFALKPA
jgi:uncharacterized protein YggE